MIKVLFITDSVLQRSGITAFIMNYLEHIPKDKVKIDLLVYESSEAELIMRAKSFGADVFFMPSLNIGNIYSFIKFLRSFFNNHHYDIVHSHFNQIDGIVFPIARKNGVKCCISHSHNTKLSENKIKSIRNRIMCWNIGWNADILAACSEKAGAVLYGQSFRKSDKKVIINNGIEVQKYIFNIEKRREIRDEYGIKDDEVVLGHVGRFRPQKNHQFLIEVFKMLCNKQSNMKLMLVGDGELKDSIGEKIKEYGLEDVVIFTGVRSDANYILSALDYFVFPSIYEGLGMALIEAQCSGLKCFASDAVPFEANISGDVVFLPIDKGIDNWVKTIIDARPNQEKDRYCYAKVVGNNGYDIKCEAKKLESMYIKAVVQ